MKILGIQSAWPIVEIAVLENQGILAERKWQSERNEIAVLMPEILGMLDEVSVELAEIQAIVVVTGPGAFSSTRIGVTMANTLAFALQARLFELSADEYKRFAQIQDIEEQKQCSFGEMLVKFFDSNPKNAAMAVPLYNSEAKITASKKPKFT